MTDLTQDWKDGKLTEGLYYIQFPRGNVIRYRLSEATKFSSDNIKILAEVPDYTAWQNLWNTADMEHKANNKLLEDVERLEKENKELKKQVNHLSKTQARQFVDNQKLQVKAEKAKDVVNLDIARKIKKLEEKLEKTKQVLKDIKEITECSYSCCKVCGAETSCCNCECWYEAEKMIEELNVEKN